MKIIRVEPGSLADELELQVGDDLQRVNHALIQDQIDFQFHASDDFVELEIGRAGETLIFEVEKDFDEPWGIEFESMKFRHCGNHCIFCFVDQNPKKLRAPLYFKDEDFRLSFLYGNYVTLTNFSQQDTGRIAEQRLSPLYVSVHAVDLDVRKKLLGIRHDDHLLEKLEFLVSHGIQIHAQIVLCPGYNDGAVLEETITRLSAFFPTLNSIAIVPIGLTRHRSELTTMQAVTPEIARQTIRLGESLADTFQKKWQHHFVYLADEFYLLGNIPLPDAARYDDFAQFENGVGMIRIFLDELPEQVAGFPERLAVPKSITLITGKLAEPVLKASILPKLNQVKNLQANLLAVENQFYGESVTVSGLLTGQDIFHALCKVESGDEVFLPQNCLNFDKLFLDDWTLEKLAQKLQRKVTVIDNDFNLFFENESNPRLLVEE